MFKSLALGIIFYLLTHVNIYAQASNVLKFQRLDFEQFEKALFSLQANPTLHISKNDLDYYLKRLKDTLRNPLSPLEQFREYSRFVARLQDGHTTVQPSKAVIREWAREKQCLPFDVVMVNKKLYISPMHPRDAEELKAKNKGKVLPAKKAKPKDILTPGMEIYAIDSLSISEWMEKIGKFISSDENGMDFKYYQAGVIFDFYRYLADPRKKQTALITYIYKKDTLSQTVPLDFPLRHTINERLNPPKEKIVNLTEKFGHFSIEKNKYGYFRFYSFKEAKGKEYDAFLKESFEALSKKKIKYLIVDVRGNTGGSMQVEFLRYLLPEGTDLGQYSFVQKRKRSELRRLKTQMREQPTKVYLRNMRLLKMNASKTDIINGSMTIEKPYKHAEFKGNIVVITDEGSFSSGAMLASHLKTLRNAKIVGAPAGGTFYGGNAGTLPVKLKKSNLVIQFNPNFFASNLFGEEVSPEIKHPDVEVFNESQIPQETYEKNKKKKKVTEDKILRDAEKALKL